MAGEIPSPAGGPRPGQAADERRADEAVDEPTVESRELARERIVFFSDAIFAISITLLVLPLAGAPIVNHDVGHQIRHLEPQILSFVLSFLVIGLFWLEHHRQFQYIAAFDAVLVRINMLFLLCVVFMPFPTAVLGTAGSTTDATVLYALTIAAAGALAALMWWYASHDRRLLAPTISPRKAREDRLLGLVSPAVFLLSVPIAYGSPSLAKYSWLLVVPASQIVRRTSRPRPTASR